MKVSTAEKQSKILPEISSGGSPPKVYVETYGCSASIADAEMTIGQLLKDGFKLVKRPTESDVNVIVTCTVKSTTENHMVSRIRRLSEVSVPLVVAGCLPRANIKAVERINPNASMLGPNCIEKSVEVVRSTISGKKIVAIEDSPRPKLKLPRFRVNPVVEIIEIANGCLSACTFCQVKIVKGRLRSYPLDAILEEVKTAISDGCKEIWLTSTDNGCYGKDMRISLPELIDAVANMEGYFWIRNGMMNPVHFKSSVDKLMIAYAHAKVFKFLHIPVQSGSERILSDMKRGHTVRDFKQMAERFRQRHHLASLATDIIVGYPGEGEDDFNETLSMIERVEPEVVNISKFGSRPGTEASKLKQLPTTVASRRTRELVEQVRSIGCKRNAKWLEWEGMAIVDERGTIEGTWMARNYAYRPIGIRSSSNLLGKTVKVRILGFQSNYLLGELIEELGENCTGQTSFSQSLSF